jgi:hypothetical protein
MADDWTDLIEGEVVDCSTISISFAATGLATVSFTVYRPAENGVPYTPGGPGFELCIGGTNFVGAISEQTLMPSTEYNKMLEWRVSAICVGCKQTCSTVC